MDKNEIFRMGITGTTAEGSGVGRHEGMAVFVPRTAVGDDILCRAVKVEKRWVYGRAEELLTPSPDRIDNDCPVFGQCGGCAWRHVTYEAECRYKAQRVADALLRIGGLSVVPEPLVPAPEIYGYRNKAQFPVNVTDGAAGFYAARSHRLIEARHCRLQPPAFKPIADKVMAWAAAHRFTALRHIYLRQTGAGDIMLCLVCSTGKLPDAGALIETVKNDVVSLVVNVNSANTNVILGGRTYTLWGACTLTDTLCGLRFRVSPAAFFQVNRVQAEMLYKIAGEYARAAGKVVWDLYCGTGTIGLTLAREAKAVVGVENAPAAVADAQENARENGINNARFFCADAAVISVGTQDSVAVWAAATETDAMGGDLRRALREFPPDVVILDPPRKGCDAAVLDTVAALAPERVVYVSCDPGTLARDLKRLGEKGYICTAVTPVDMFPRTAHVECVALAEKKG